MQMKVTRRYMMAALAGAAVLVAGVAAHAGNLTGKYSVKGRNPDGSQYTGKVNIIDNNGAVAMSWHVGNTYSGAGRVVGRVLTVDWGSDAPVIYVINTNGTLYGTWAKGTALELLTKQ